ncbi:hypothetical protein KI427_27135 (plasmid) [Rhodococcus ruber]|uniref:hypothetical protein n=1 Tax=Rhodococcus ruber TaxID=1830 RepID=UPI0031FF1F55|nr:hypothetical protein KI427_27135 [Rhodococcus ruber]
MQPVEPMHRDVPAGEGDEFAAPDRPRETEQQDRGIAAFQNLIGPTPAARAGFVDDGEDVGGE